MVEDSDDEFMEQDLGEEADSDDDSSMTGASGLGESIQAAWVKRENALMHDYAVAGYALSVALEVVKYRKSAPLTSDQRHALERVVRKLHASPDPNKDVCGPNNNVKGKAIDEIVDMFWDEYQEFVDRSGWAGNKSRWNCQDANQGRSHLWHRKYSLPHTNVLGFVACRVTSKTLGIGPCERVWGDLKTIKDGKRKHLGGASTEKRTVLYSSAKINQARIKRDIMSKLDAEGPNALFCDDDMK